MSIPFCQSHLEHSEGEFSHVDWAGVEGDWQCSFCYIDHRDFLGELKIYCDSISLSLGISAFNAQRVAYRTINVRNKSLIRSLCSLYRVAVEIQRYSNSQISLKHFESSIHILTSKVLCPIPIIL